MLCLALMIGGTTGCETTPPPKLLAPGARAHSVTASYSVGIESGAWHSILAADEGQPKRAQKLGNGGDIPPTLSLFSEELSSWILGLDSVGSGAQLDNIVANRRELMIESGATDYREYRRFLGETNQITASLSRYVAGQEVILVLTAIREPIVVELIGGTVRGAGGERALIEVLESIQIPAQDGVNK